MSLLFIDNQDSFTYNILDSLYRVGVMHVDIAHSDEIASYEAWEQKIESTRPTYIVVGPGPGAPSDLPHILHIIRKYEHMCPILGICLGHQMIVTAYGGQVSATGTPVHGKRSLLRHSTCNRLFASLPPLFYVGRYHSLAAHHVPPPLQITAWVEENEPLTPGTIMAVEHDRYPIYGVQFHPESFLSDQGLTLLENFIKMPMHS